MLRGFTIEKENSEQTLVSETNSEPELITTDAPQSIRKILGLPFCRITQQEDNHILKGNGSMYAIDIACTRGQNFPAYAASFYSTYTVSKISYDSRLGRYIIISNGDEHFLYAHVTPSVSLHDTVTSGQQIGVIDKSGMSTNFHLHFEIWKDGYNISIRDYMKGIITQNTEHSASLLKQRQTQYSFEIFGTNKEKAKWAYDYALSLGFDSYQSARLVAQIHQENGKWSPPVRGDKGCSVGLTQWNECARGPLPVGHDDWQGQIKLMIDEIHGRFNGKNFYQVQVSWNAPVTMVKGDHLQRRYYREITDSFHKLFSN